MIVENVNLDHRSPEFALPRSPVFEKTFSTCYIDVTKFYPLEMRRHWKQRPLYREIIVTLEFVIFSDNNLLF